LVFQSAAPPLLHFGVYDRHTTSCRQTHPGGRLSLPGQHRGHPFGTGLRPYGPIRLSSGTQPQEVWGVKLHHTTAYHPQANRLCEQFHHTMKAALRPASRAAIWSTRSRGLCWVLGPSPRRTSNPCPPNWFVNSTAPWFASQQRTTLLDSARVLASQFHVPTSLTTARFASIVDIGGKPEHVLVVQFKPTEHYNKWEKLGLPSGNS